MATKKRATFVKRLIQKAAPELPVPTGNLKASELSLRLAVHHGIPHTAAVLAYEPVQRILAVSCSDGRTKILGDVGVEGLLQSPTHFPCKFLEFLNNQGLLVHINTHNDIEVWDVEKLELVYFQKWEAEITSYHVLQGSPFMYLGDESGAVYVLQFINEDSQLNVMPYVIPAHVTLGGLLRIGSSDHPSVIGTLPQPDVFYTRLLVAYGNGLIILWGLHETQVVAVRGGTDYQRLQLSNFAASLKGRAIPTPTTKQKVDDEEEEKEICCICWACPVGSVLAVGYTDGQILLWSLPTIISGKGQLETEFLEGPAYSGEPLHIVDLAPGKQKMPVVSMTWSASPGSIRGVGGRLYVFGGREVGQSEAIMVISLDALHLEESGAKLFQLELDLRGPFADMALLPEIGGSVTSPAAALALLMMPGLLHVFDELSIRDYFAALAEGTQSPPTPQPVPFQLPITKTKVTCAQLVLLSNDGLTTKVLLQLPESEQSPVPSVLPAGTKWPISGGALTAPTSSGAGVDQNLYIAGHENGLVTFWDVSSYHYRQLCSVDGEYGTTSRGKPLSNEKCPVTTIAFCGSSGLLAVGRQNGMVFVYELDGNKRELLCCTVSLESTGDDSVDCEPGFGCTLIQNVHKASIGAISIARGPSTMAVGDESGMVSLIDLQSSSILFYDSCFPNNPSPVLSVAFAMESLLSDGTPMALSPRTLSFSKGRPAPVPVGHAAVLYVVGKDASIVAIDGCTGAIFGSGALQPKHPSIAVSLHLLGAGGAPITALDSVPDEVLESGTHSDQVDLPSCSTSSLNDESQRSVPIDEETEEVPLRKSRSEAMYLLLCCTDSLRLYATTAVIQGIRNASRKVSLDKTCCWTSPCSNKSTGDSGLILMYTNGDLEIRSLPDLELLKETSFSTVINWKYELSFDSQGPIACNANGQLVVVDHGSELFHVSVFEDGVAREQPANSRLYDKDLAKAADAAISYARNSSKKKLQTPIQGMQSLLGGVLRELKTALDIEQEQVIHRAPELPMLFASSPFTVVPVQSSPSSPIEASGSSTSPKGTALNIDDIDLEELETEPAQAAAPPEASKGNKFANKFAVALKSLKGKERSDDAESNRMKLFDGKDDSKPSKAQTVDDIRAKYGHARKSQELSGVMDMTRNKLAERGEKLQDISDKTAEMEDNAENFASMAEELAKRVSQKKWWEL